MEKILLKGKQPGQVIKTLVGAGPRKEPGVSEHAGGLGQSHTPAG